MPDMTTTQAQGESLPRVSLWNPTREQMNAYMQREVEMCKKAIEEKRVDQRDYGLFSHRTWEIAKRTEADTTR